MESLRLHEEEKLKKHALLALELAGKKADYADVLIESVAKIEAKLLADGREIILPYSSKAAMQLRMMKKDGRHINASFGIDEAGLNENIETAAKILEGSEPDSKYGLAPIPNPKKKRYGKEIRRDIRRYDAGKEMALVVSEIRKIAEHYGKMYNAEIKPEVWVFTQIEEKIIADTRGVYKTQILPTTFLQILVKARRNGRMSQYRIRHADIDEISMLVEEGKLRDNVRKKAENCMHNAGKLLDARKLTANELKSLTHYILMPTTMVFVHEAQGHNFEADIVKEGGSGIFFANGKPRNERIGAQAVDLFDAQPMDEEGKIYRGRGFGTQYIDDEGVEMLPVHMVKAGKVKEKLNNRETAYFFRERPNGRGFSELGDERIVRMTNTYIKPASGVKVQTFEKLISDVKFGVALEGSLGGQVSKEGMATSVQIGWLIQNGKVTDIALLPANLAVDTKTSLMGVNGFAGKVELPDAGFCGKGGQVKFVTDGGTIIKLKASKSVNIGY